MESASVPVLLRNSSIYLAALHLLKKFCAGEFQVATSLLGAHLGAQRIHGVEITAEMALVGARMAPLGAGVGAAAPGLRHRIGIFCTCHSAHPRAGRYWP